MAPGDRQMLFAGLAWLEVGMVEQGTGGNACIRGNAFVTGVTGDGVRRGMADDGGKD